MVSKLLIVLAFSQAAFADYTNGTVLVGSTGARTVSVTNSGSFGLPGLQVLKLPVGASQKFKVWFVPSGINVRGSESACADPCSAQMNTDMGPVPYFYEITDSAGNPLNPRLLSSVQRLAQTKAPAMTAPFTVPLPVHGLGGYERDVAFSIAGGTDVSNVRVYIYAWNLRQGLAYFRVNGGAKHVLSTTPITQFSSNGSVCTGTTSVPHGLSNGQQVQLNFFHDAGVAQGSATGDAALNGSFTIASVPTATTFTVSCSVPAADWNTNFGTVGVPHGKTVSATTFYIDESRWYGGMDANRRPVQIAVPLGSTELVAGQTNTISWGFSGSGDVSQAGLVHGWYLLNWNIIQADAEMDQIVVSGANATARTTTSNTFASNDTVLIRDAPGPYWRFCGTSTIASITDSTHFVFAWGQNIKGGSAGVSPYTTAAATYTLPSTNDASIAPLAHMYVAKCLISKTNFQDYDPTTFASLGGNASNGQTLWTSGALQDRNSYYPTTVATCSGCHAVGGDDLKKFGYSPQVIVTAAMDRGLSWQNGADIWEFIKTRAVTTPTHCRPWNGLYQGMPGADSNPIEQWTCGGGIEWLLSYGDDMKEWMVPGGSYAAWSAISNFPIHEIPTNFSLRPWNRWLPEVDPRDYFTQVLNQNFTANAMWTDYQSWAAALLKPTTLSGPVLAGDTSWPVTDRTGYANNDFIMADDEYVQITAGGATTGAGSFTVSRAQKGSTAAAHSSGAFVPNYTKYAATTLLDFYHSNFRAAYLAFSSYRVGALGVGTAGDDWPSQYGIGYLAVHRFGLAKMWELFNVYHLENFLDQSVLAEVKAANGGTAINPDGRVAAMYRRGHGIDIYFLQAPHRTSPAALSYMNRYERDGHNWNLDSEIDYHLQAVLNPGDRMQQSNAPIDTQYQYSFYSNVGLTYRPSIYGTLLTTAFTPQNTLGQPTMNSPACIVPQAYMAKFTNDFQGSDLFTPESPDKASIVAEIAALLLEGINYYGTTAWRTYINSCGEGTSHVADATQAYNRTGTISDSIAFLLPQLTYYSVSSTTINSIATAANTIWAESGHDFNTDKAATCSFQGTPRRLKCTNGS